MYITGKQTQILKTYSGEETRLVHLIQKTKLSVCGDNTKLNRNHKILNSQR